MLFSVNFLASCAILATAVSASSYIHHRPFHAAISRRQNHVNATSSLTVDLGYEVYQGVDDTSTGLHTFKGIRYAAPPTGQLRWQAPQPPTINRGQVLQASTFASRCPQAPYSPMPPGYDITGDEDCLFLSVYAPANANNLPVLVWIHGGGYGIGQGDQDLSAIINANNNSFIGVAIQYRLGAFGFMSSDETMRFGVVNAGLLDQHFALQWVQSYIGLFGGSASQVTISGESAGGGSVMLQAMAFGGYLGDSLFSNIIAASPYLPTQYGYKDFVPSQSYYAFAQAAGCFGGLPQNNVNNSIFACLVGKDTTTLQNASAYISGSGKYGSFNFLPVTDGVFIQQLPSQQLLKKQVNGKYMLSGNNANEGPSFVPQNIVTEGDFVSFLRNTFPLFTNEDIAKVLLYYPSTNASVDTNAPNFPTLGYTGPTALNESSFGTGQQQRADNLYAEMTFVCPSYWLAEAFSGNGRTAYKYQYSVPGAQHGSDMRGYFGPPQPNQGPDFEKAFMNIWGAFITHSNPSIPASIANGASSPFPRSSHPASAWPPYTNTAPYQINLNETGGVPFSAPGVSVGINVTVYEGPGLRNEFTVVDAWAWEGGRGVRCDFWRGVGAVVPA
ncbi:MAG: hypothetical protein FRX48_06196 [Lasallia pustulata]|uniref:Carboxylic ester hydrolase n=1 Tax=Lasallia pustulata TaxID=136370 RepID=A0A5M8PKW7_9LECA|nr:MAG: hypothetical protein FRX48_06196 [Lasallia pustulata]